MLLARKSREIPNGIDMTLLDVTDLNDIHLEANENTVSVSYSISVGDNFETTADYEESFSLDDEDDPPPELVRAARELAAVVTKLVKSRYNYGGDGQDVPCKTCVSACCGMVFDSVRLTHADVANLEAAGVSVEDQVHIYGQPTMGGYVGQFKLVQHWSMTDRKCCPNLGPDGCKVYEHRPKICREFSAWDCEHYEEDPEKKDGKVRLRVLKE